MLRNLNAINNSLCFESYRGESSTQQLRRIEIIIAIRNFIALSREHSLTDHSMLQSYSQSTFLSQNEIRTTINYKRDNESRTGVHATVNNGSGDQCSLRYKIPQVCHPPPPPPALNIQRVIIRRDFFWKFMFKIISFVLH